MKDLCLHWDHRFPREPSPGQVHCRENLLPGNPQGKEAVHKPLPTKSDLGLCFSPPTLSTRAYFTRENELLPTGNPDLLDLKIQAQT